MEVQTNLWTAMPRPSLRLISVIAQPLLCAIICANAAAQPRYLLQQENGEKETIHVWKVGSPYKGDLPNSHVAPEVLERAAKLDCRLDVRTMLARDFSASFAAALKTNDEPDILVIDNYGLIFGITTPLGRFEAISRYPKAPASFITVSESLRSLQAGSGWEFLIRTSRNHLKAKALAFSGRRCNPMYSDQRKPWTAETLREVSQLAQGTTAAYFNNDEEALDSLVGGRYAADSLPLSETPNQVSSIESCGGWGNDRLAFIHTVTSFEGKDRLGFRSLLVVAAKEGEHWQLLLLGETPDIVKRLQGQPWRLTNEEGAASQLRAPTLLAPANEAYFKRWPAEERPELAWTTVSGGRIKYLLEWQYKDRASWHGRAFDLTAGAREEDLVISYKAKFGIGKQPHRWRIWAIRDNGEVVRSEWRVVNYLD